MRDSRAGKTFHINWEEWREECSKRDIDPWDEYEEGGGEITFDLQGGDWYSIKLIEEPPEKEED